MLTPFQEQIARIVLEATPDPALAVAGGAALISTGRVERSTVDLDFFTPAGGVDDLLQPIEAALRARGMEVEPIYVGTSFVRVIVSRGDDRCRVDLGVDHRMLPAEPGPLGRTVASDELAADKVLALFDRADPRDYVDVHALARHHGRDRLLELASMKDPGFDTRVFADMLGAIGRLEREEFEVDDATYASLCEFFEDWRGELSS